MPSLLPSRGRLGERLRGLFSRSIALDASVLSELEDILLAADLGPALAEEVLEKLKVACGPKVANRDELMNRLAQVLVSLFPPDPQGPLRRSEGLTVTLMVGVNGSGKTTSIAKLAATWSAEGRRVLLAAGDTFRAAAADQLEIWAGRLHVDIVRHAEGADPSAVVHDALEAAAARGIDDLIVDTAGRLHTQSNLMAELEKIRRTLQRRDPSSPHETLLVLDATAGQNALNQAREFSKRVPLTGIFLSKLDGTARGGSVLAVARETGVAVKYAGTGEHPEHLTLFRASEFVESLLS
ncbi:MAG: signal recognition particle-docking protein FtsY [Planctomycetota bacterium]